MANKISYKHLTYATAILLMICAAIYFTRDAWQLLPAIVAMTGTSDEQAIKLLTPLASKGNITACRLLGVLYTEGHGVPVNYRKAIEFLQRAAAAGDSIAQSRLKDLLDVENYQKPFANNNAKFELAEIYREGKQLPRDWTKAEALYEQLSGARDKRGDWGLWQLGLYYVRGIDQPCNLAKARALFEKSVKNGEKYAMADLAYLKLNGLGGPLDTKSGVELCIKADKLGNDIASCNLGLIYMSGKLVKLDYSRAAEYFTRSAQSANGNAECILAHLYQTGTGVTKNLQKSDLLMKSALSHGCAEGEYEIGRRYYYGTGFAKNYAKARHWLEMAAAGGNPHAMNELAKMYACGDGVTASEKTALALQIKANENGCPYAKYNLAERYRSGDGVPKDLQKAKELYQQCVTLGVAIAGSRLKALGND